MKAITDVLENVKPFNSKNCENAVKEYIEKNELGMGAVLNALRLCLVGAAKGPHLFDIIELIGKDETLNRIKTGVENISR